MKLMLVTHGFPPERFGGTETYTRWLAHAMLRRGHEVVVVTRTASEGGEYSVKEYRDDALKVLAIRNTYSFHYGYEAHYRNPHMDAVFARLVDNFGPDVVHCTYLLGGLSAGFVNVSKSRGINTILTLTDYHHMCAWGQFVKPDGSLCEGPKEGLRCAECFTGESPYEGVAAFKRPFYKLMSTKKRAVSLPGAGIRRMNDRINYLRDTLNRADRIIFPTNVLAVQYLAWGVDGTHLPFGLDKSLFHGFKREPSSKVRFAFIGQLSAHKGLHVLCKTLEGMTDLKGWSLDIYAAMNTEEEKKYLDDCINKLGDRASFLGTFDPLDIGRVFERMDVLVVPSMWSENSPLVTLYAVHTGTTLVSSDIWGVREVAGDWGLYFPMGGSLALGKILRKLVNDRGLLARSGAPGIPDIADHARIVEQIYRGEYP